MLEKFPCRHPGEKCKNQAGSIHSWEVTCLISSSQCYIWRNSVVAWCKNKETAQTFTNSASQSFDPCRLAAEREHVAVAPVSVTSHFEQRGKRPRGATQVGNPQTCTECEKNLLQVQLCFITMVNMFFWLIEWNVNNRVKVKRKLIIGSVCLAGCSSQQLSPDCIWQPGISGH